MKITTLFFGISSDLVGSSQLEITIAKPITIANFKNILKEKHTQLEHINSYAIAVNEAYATNDVVLNDNDVVAIIPPVSGG